MQSKFTLPIVLVSLIAVFVLIVEQIFERNRVHELVIATATQDGEYYHFGEALAEVVARHDPKIRIRVQETEGSPQNIALLEKNQVQLAIVQSDTAVVPSERAVAFLFPEVLHLIAATNSNIQSMADLRGKRLALMPKGSGSYRLFWAISQHYGLTEANVRAIALPPEEASTALRQGRVDALFRVIAVGNASLSQLLSTTSARLVPIDQAAALQLSLPYLEATQIAKGTYSGAVPVPPEDVPVVAVRAVLVARADVDEAVVQDITRILFEFRNELVAKYPRAASFRLPDSGENLGLPLHPGARTYYNNDQPSFFVEYADLIGLMLSVGVLLISGFWQFRLWLLGKQKDRADRYNLRILDLIAQVEVVYDLQQLEKIRHQLFEIFQNVVMDLDKDRISPESFQAFVFPWEVAISTIRHREVVLMNLRQK